MDRRGDRGCVQQACPKRGLQLVYDIDLDKAVDDKTSVLARDLTSGIAAAGIAATVHSSPTYPAP